MGKRSRKRGVSTTVDERPGPARAPKPEPKSRVDRFIERADQRPRAPWDPFPLVELCVLAGIVLIILGVLDAESRDGRILLAFGLTLASLAGLDTAAREHFGGFRSHSTLLAGVPAVLLAGLLYYLGAPWLAIVLGTAAALGVGIVMFRAAFRNRSGGVAFKV